MDTERIETQAPGRDRTADGQAVTQILKNWSNEGQAQRAWVVSVMYDQLRHNAVAHLRKESRSELQPTALVHEAYDRLINVSRMDLNSRSHFLGLAGKIMRDVLVDQARRARAQKRGPGLQTAFTDIYGDTGLPVMDIIEMDRLLAELANLDADYVALFEARAFAGMTVEEAATYLSISPSTVKRRWKVVLAWLNDRMS